MTSLFENDKDLTAEQLADKYNPEGDGEHPIITRECWRNEVFEGNTLLGYWDWIANEIEHNAEGWE